MKAGANARIEIGAMHRYRLLHPNSSPRFAPMQTASAEG